MPHTASTGKSVTAENPNASATKDVTTQSEKLSKLAALRVSDLTFLFLTVYMTPMKNLTATEIRRTTSATSEYCAFWTFIMLFTEETTSSAPTTIIRRLTKRVAIYSSLP